MNVCVILRNHGRERIDSLFERHSGKQENHLTHVLCHLAHFLDDHAENQEWRQVVKVSESLQLYELLLENWPGFLDREVAPGYEQTHKAGVLDYIDRCASDYLRDTL